MLELGIKAPDFELPDQNGEVHKLSDYLGKKIILYFYFIIYESGEKVNINYEQIMKLCFVKKIFFLISYIYEAFCKKI